MITDPVMIILVIMTIIMTITMLIMTIVMTIIMLIMTIIIIRDVVSNGVGGTEYAQPMVEGGRGQILVIVTTFNQFSK